MTERDDPRPGDDEAGGRVRGAWTTPSVVVRRPDGSVVDDRSAPGDPAPPAAPEADPAPRAGRGPAAPRPRGARPRPRRIPGAPGAVLLTPTLSEQGGDPAGRRLRRNSGTPASVTPLPPRPRRAGGTGDIPTVTPAGAAASGAVDGASTPGAGSARPSLKVVGEALRRGARPSADRRRTSGQGASGPGPTRPGERRAPRVVEGLRNLDLERLLPSDPDARAERVARLRRIGVRAAAVVVAAVLVYTVFPVRTALNLQAAENRARERQAAFERENEILEDEARDLQTDDRVEQEARELGLVYPGEESYGIYPAPEAPATGAASTTTSTTTPAG